MHFAIELIEEWWNQAGDQAPAVKVRAVCRHEFTAGTYTFDVKGVATTSNYILMVYITNERLLNPNEQLIMGQANHLPVPLCV